MHPVARRWLTAIANGDVDAARDVLIDDNVWAMDRISAALAAIAGDPDFHASTGPPFAITPPDCVQVAERFDIPELNEVEPIMSYWMLDMNPQLTVDHPHCIGDLLYPLPINGYWSDINTSFHLRKIDDQSVALLLNDFVAIRDD